MQLVEPREEREEESGKKPKGSRPGYPRRAASGLGRLIRREQHGAYVGAHCGEGSGRQLFPCTTHLLNHGTELRCLAGAVGAERDETAAGVEQSERVVDVMGVGTVRERRVHDDPVEGSESVALQEITL